MGAPLILVQFLHPRAPVLYDQQDEEEEGEPTAGRLSSLRRQLMGGKIARLKGGMSKAHGVLIAVACLPQFFWKASYP